MPNDPKPTKYDKQQNADIARLEERIKTVGERPTDPESLEGNKQWLRIHVPKPETTLLLGERDTKSGTAFGYPGASLQTVGNLFADINEAALVQSKGPLILQTTDQMQHYADARLELSSAQSVKVVGGNVVLGAVKQPAPAEMREAHGAALAPNSPNSLDRLIGYLEDSREWLREAADTIGVAHTLLFLSIPSDLQGKVKAADTYLGLLNRFVKPHGPDAAPAPAATNEVTVFGQDAVSVMSEKTVDVSATESINLTSGDTSTITSKLKTTIQAGWGVKVIALAKASLESAVWTDIKAGSIVGVSALKGAIKLKARSIDLGDVKKNLQQVATETVSVLALENIAIGNKAPTKDAARIRGPIARIKSRLSASPTPESADPAPAIPPAVTKTVTVSAKEIVQISVGDFTIEIKPDGIKVGTAAPSEKGRVFSDPLVTVSKNGEIVLKSSEMGVRVEKRRVFLGKTGQHMTITDSGTATLKAGTIKLG